MMSKDSKNILVKLAKNANKGHIKINPQIFFPYRDLKSQTNRDF